jgi:hypothetical protein
LSFEVETKMVEVWKVVEEWVKMAVLGSAFMSHPMDKSPLCFAVFTCLGSF